MVRCCASPTEGPRGIDARRAPNNDGPRSWESTRGESPANQGRAPARRVERGPSCRGKMPRWAGAGESKKVLDSLGRRASIRPPLTDPTRGRRGSRGLPLRGPPLGERREARATAGSGKNRLTRSGSCTKFLSPSEAWASGRESPALCAASLLGRSLKTESEDSAEERVPIIEFG
jgi:hypothetical protein